MLSRADAAAPRGRTRTKPCCGKTEFAPFKFEKMYIQIAWIVFLFYLAVMLGTGLYGWKRRCSGADFLLGGRRLAPGRAALSAQVGEISGWLFLGLPGAVYLSGWNPVWIAAGLLAGSILNWIIIAPRLRIASEQLQAETLPGFLARRFGDRSGLLRLFAAGTLLICFVGYAAGGLAESARILENTLGIPYFQAVAAVALMILTYSAAGGFPAVCRTDILQSILVLGALIILPLGVLLRMEPGTVADAVALRESTGAWAEVTPEIFPGARYGGPEPSGPSWLIVLSSLGWGAGFFGLPHVLSRFMAIRSVRLLPRAARIAALWTGAALTGAILTALTAIPVFGQMPPEDHQQLFFQLNRRFFTPYLGGVLLAAVVTAVVAALDSLLLAAGSTAGADGLGAVVRSGADDRLKVRNVRLAMAALMLAAAALAIGAGPAAARLIPSAWAGFGAVLAPAVLAALYLRGATGSAVLCGMAAGALTLIVWQWCGLRLYCYEIIPGFLVNVLTVVVCGRCFPLRSEAVARQFRQMEEALHESGR